MSQQDYKAKELPIDPKLVVAEPQIQTLFADGFSGLAFINNVARLNLYEDKLNPETEEITRHIIARLVLPADSFNSMLTVMTDLKKSMDAEKQTQEEKK